MSNDELDEIKSLLNKISHGPWMATNKDKNKTQNWIVECGAIDDVHQIALCNTEAKQLQEFDAKFIALSRQIVPKMIDEIHRLKETIRQLNQGMPLAGD